MCGIVGFIDQDCRAMAQTLAVMEAAIFARGPDGAGHFIEGPLAMGMRRLAIIDVVHGNQPLTSCAGQVVAFQNGEIYNHRELRSELTQAGHDFQTVSDTEVLAHGYAAWGLDGLLARIDGMYAVAIVDRRSGELHLARDRLGEKPLYYVAAGQRFAYASDLRVLAGLPWVGSELDPLSLERYLALHYVPGDRTILATVRRLLPGQCLSVAITQPEPRLTRYYRPPLQDAPRVSDDELAAILEAAVASRLISDMPVGVFLSGGLDSSIIATLAARQQPAISTFSIGFDSQCHDETVYAKQLAGHIGSSHHHFIFDENAFNQLLPDVAAALDEPLGDQAMLPLFWLCREARKHVTVALAGEGADEIFAGYSYYAPFAPAASLWRQAIAWLRHRPQAQPWGRLIDNPLPVTPSGFPLLTDQGNRFSLTGQRTGQDAWEEEMCAWLDTAGNPLQRATAADLASWLPDDLLVKFDRMAMANSLEGRAPFLDPKLVALGMSRLPAADRMRGGNSKIALRRVASRWLPEDILLRRKQGFVLPMGNWLRNWFAAKGGACAYFSASPVPGLLIPELARLVEDDLKAGIQRERLLFALIALQEWHLAFTAKVAKLRSEFQACAA